MTDHINLADSPLIQVRRLRVEFGRQAVLRDIDLAIPRGQTLAIIGESGCGKTVLLKTLIGLVQPTQGEVVFDGHVLNKLSERELTDLRTRFGYVFLICATGRSAVEMLAALRSRLSNDPSAELQIAAGEQAKITALRLKALA